MSKKSKLSQRERERYSRNMLINEWNGEEGQLKLKSSKVLVVGAGGSGSPLLYYLTTAGVGTIRLCDGDVVNLDNLNRQILHNEGRLGMSKAESAKRTLESLNSDVSIEAFNEPITLNNIEALAAECDLICCAADGRDERIAYKVLDQYSYKNKIPVVWAGGYYMGGFLTVIKPPETPCIECYMHHSDKAVEQIKQGKMVLPDDAGVPADGPNPIVGAAAGVAGSLQALEAVRNLLGIGKRLLGLMLMFQMRDDVVFRFYNIDALRRPECPYCGSQ